MKGYITQDIIDKAVISHPDKCIGAWTLRQALGDNERYLDYGTSWVDVIGIHSVNQIPVLIGTEGNVDMMKQLKPMEVTFIILRVGDNWT